MLYRYPFDWCNLSGRCQPVLLVMHKEGEGPEYRLRLEDQMSEYPLNVPNPSDA